MWSTLVPPGRKKARGIRNFLHSCRVGHFLAQLTQVPVRSPAIMRSSMRIYQVHNFLFVQITWQQIIIAFVFAISFFSERAAAKRRLEKMVIKKGRFQNADQSAAKQKAISPQELLQLLQSRDQDSEVRSSNVRTNKGKFCEGLEATKVNSQFSTI